MYSLCKGPTTYRIVNEVYVAKGKTYHASSQYFSVTEVLIAQLSVKRIGDPLCNLSCTQILENSCACFDSGVSQVTSPLYQALHHLGDCPSDKLVM
jgi:hypothetical protein